MIHFRPGRRAYRPSLRGRARLVRVHARPAIERWVVAYLDRNGMPTPTMPGEFVTMATPHGFCSVAWHDDGTYTVEELR